MIIFILIIVLLIFIIITSLIENNFFTKFDNTEYIKYFLNNEQKFKSVVILGCARDVSNYLNILFKSIEEIQILFDKSKIIIYENDSNDNTLELLNNWGKAQVISEKNVPGERTHRLSHGRNILLTEALKENSEYIIILDLDDRCHNIKLEGIVDSLKKLNDNEKYAMMGANQKDYYYDLWALRTFDDWMPGDFLSRVNCGPEQCDSYRNIPEDTGLVEVKSCFGGLAIYKTKFIKNCKYYGGEGSDNEVCEHVDFNECIYANNGKLFINPKMINS